MTNQKTNWKFVAIVVVLVVIVGGGILWWVEKSEVHLAEFLEVKKPKKVVEEETICGVSDPLHCNDDKDCICEARGCFRGNKHYYEKCINKEKICLDYCGLPGSTTISKCVQNKCTFELKTW